MNLKIRSLVSIMLIAVVWVFGAHSAQAQTNSDEVSHTRMGGECWDIEVVDFVLYAA